MIIVNQIFIVKKYVTSSAPNVISAKSSLKY